MSVNLTQERLQVALWQNTYSEKRYFTKPQIGLDRYIKNSRFLSRFSMVGLCRKIQPGTIRIVRFEFSGFYWISACAGVLSSEGNKTVIQTQISNTNNNP